MKTRSLILLIVMIICLMVIVPADKIFAAGNPETGIFELKAPAPGAAGLKSSAPGAAELKTSAPEAAELKTSAPEAAELKSSAPEAAGLKSSAPGVAELKTSAPDAAELKSLVLGAAGLKSSAPEASELKTSALGANDTGFRDSVEYSSKLLYLGHASLRIVTPEGKVIYIDPFAGDEYDLAADMILVTHGHYDHNALEKVENRNSDCQIITWEEALAEGEHQTFNLDYVTVEAVEAGYNKNHDVRECVGYILTLSDGVTIYVSGDTSRTEQMPLLAEREIDYAFYCCDGVYNMGLEEAAECADLVGAKHNTPYHIIPPNEGLFDMEKAEQFQAENRLIIEAGEEIELDHTVMDEEPDRTE